MTDAPAFTLPDTIAVGDVIASDRIRKDYQDVEALGSSIRRYGVIQPIVLTQGFAPDGRPQYVLVAGGRRLAALQRIGTTHLRHGKEFVWRNEDVRDPSTAIRLQAMELEENVKRSDLTWSETALAKLKLLKLMQSIHGVSRGFGAGKTSVYDRGFGIRTLAEMLSENASTTSRDIEIAEYIKRFPLAKLEELPTRVDAMRRMGVVFTTASMVQQTKAAPPLVSPATPPPASSSGQVTSPPTGVNGSGTQPCGTAVPLPVSHGDLSRWLLYEGNFQNTVHRVADASVDLVLTDLPYNIAIGTGNVGHGSAFGNQFTDSVVDLDSLCRDVAVASYRVLRSNRFAVFFYGMAYHAILYNALVDAGFAVDPYPFIWQRDRTAPPDGFARYSKSYDPALVASKGVPRFIRPNLPNILAIPSVRGPARLHSAQKPVELMAKFVEDMTIPGCVVLDMFAGSGTTGEAALLLKRKAILFECEPANCFIIKSRLGAIP